MGCTIHKRCSVILVCANTATVVCSSINASRIKQLLSLSVCRKLHGVLRTAAESEMNFLFQDDVHRCVVPDRCVVLGDIGTGGTSEVCRLAECDIGLAMLPTVRNKLPAKGSLCVKRHVAISSEQAVSALDSRRSKVHVSHHTTPYPMSLKPDIRASTQCAMAIVMFLRPLQLDLKEVTSYQYLKIRNFRLFDGVDGNLGHKSKIYIKEY